MESLAARLGSVVLQQIGHLMEVMGQTQGMSTCSTRDRSHGRAAGRPYCRKDETEAPSEPSQIAKEAATRALSRYRRIDALLEANPDPDNCCIVTSNILLSPHAPAPLGGVCADPPHEDILNSWLCLMLPLGIWKGALHLNVAAVSLFLLLHRIIGGRQPTVHGPSVNQTTWLEKGENNKPQVSHGSESRIVGETASKPGESSTGGKRAAKKQSQRGDGGHDEDDDDDDGGDRPRHPKRMRSEARDEIFFACPFLKHNPRKYQSCMGRMWPAVHRVKEHLYRRHQLPEFQCLRCYKTFTNSDGLNIHHKQPIPCDVVDHKVADGISQLQVMRLKSRRRNRFASEEDKWRDMYKIVFPLEEIPPSPYYTYEDANSAILNGSTTLIERFLDAVPKRFGEYAAQLDPVQTQQVVASITSAFEHSLETVLDSVSSGDTQTMTDTQEVRAHAAFNLHNPQDHTSLLANGDGQTVDRSYVSPYLASVDFAGGQQSPPGIGDATRKRRDPRGEANNNNHVDSSHTDRKDKHDIWPIRHSEEERQPDNLLACPFYKLDPYRHYRCLEKHKLKRLADVRQHITRAHVIKDYYCTACWAPFKQKDILDSHVRAGDCPGVPEPKKIGIDNPILHGLLPEEAERLAEIPRLPTETDKWYWMWDVLFSEHARPASPYVMEGIAEPIALLARQGETELQANLPALLRAHDNRSDPESVAKLARDITRIVCNIPPPVSQSFFRKLPHENTDSGIRPHPIETYSSTMDGTSLPADANPHVSYIPGVNDLTRLPHLEHNTREAAAPGAFLMAHGFGSLGEFSEEQLLKDFLGGNSGDLLDINGETREDSGAREDSVYAAFLTGVDQWTED